MSLKIKRPIKPKKVLCSAKIYQRDKDLLVTIGEGRLADGLRAILDAIRPTIERRYGAAANKIIANK